MAEVFLAVEENNNGKDSRKKTKKKKRQDKKFLPAGYPSRQVSPARESGKMKYPGKINNTQLAQA